ncbi:MAG: DUF4328 domain-containing protein [Verrucomicrobiaceae bacterium]
MSENPYLPPQTNADPSSALPRHPGQGSPYGPFRDTGTLALIILTLFSLLFIATLASAYVGWFELSALDTRGYDYTSIEYEVMSKFREALNPFSKSIGLFIIIFWCIWANQSCKNAWLINSRDGATAVYRGRESFTPGWTVGWFFIPIANLWKPLQAMAWIRDASQKPLGLTMGKLLGFWWTFWLISRFTGEIVERLGTMAATPVDLATYFRIFIVLIPLDLIAITFASLVVFRLTRIQKIRARELSLI